MTALPLLKQRADYTHKYNVSAGRHGWIRLTPAYSVKIVDEILGSHPPTVRVFDPFCGTGTTALCAIEKGVSATTIDINPFLVWLAKAKTARYSPDELASAQRIANMIVSQKRTDLPPPPAIHNINKWWGAREQGFLRKIKGGIGDAKSIGDNSRNILKVAFCRTLIRLSNASFCHQSMSFQKKTGKIDLNIDPKSVFLSDVAQVVASATGDFPISADVRLHDATNIHPKIFENFDLVVTSPPYSNRMSYIRELRPYMYWLDYLKEPKDAGDMDWRAIGGTWGTATSRLKHWSPSNKYKNANLSKALHDIKVAGGSNGDILSRYVCKYFEDIFTHLSMLPPLLNKGAEAHFIVGNSVFYGVLVCVEEIYADMLKILGFSSVAIRPVRKRNSKKELIEFDVTAKWAQ